MQFQFPRFDVTRVPHRLKELLRIPGLGRLLWSVDLGQAIGTMGFQTHLMAEHRDPKGRPIKRYDLGSGLVTNVGVLALANDFAQTVTNAPHNLFRSLKYHASGTGATAAAATDIKLQTPSTVGGQTPVAGTQVLVSAANLQKYQSVATISYTNAEAVTEWGFFAYDSSLPAVTNLSDATGSPFTAGGATSGTVTGTPLTASSATVQGQILSVFENTNGTCIDWGLVTSNTTSIVTVPAWYKTADGTVGSNPVNADTYVIRPVMWDHKVFGAINVANGDSIQFSYLLTCTAGG